MFPSPYGVSFILIDYHFNYEKVCGEVSVSLRSIVHSYELIITPIKVYKIEFPSPYGVSFILIIKLELCYKSFYPKSFRLLTEYRSFLSEVFTGTKNQEKLQFPSPYGVSFILM